MKNIHLVVLAGGYGTRLASVVSDRPKPMALVNGTPFISIMLDHVLSIGINKITILAGYKGEKILDFVRNTPRYNGVDVRIESHPKGTAGAFFELVHESESTLFNWVVLNGDSMVDGGLKPFIEKCISKSYQCALLSVPNQSENRFGVLECSTDGRLIRFNEKKQMKGPINAGVYYFTQAVCLAVTKVIPMSFEYNVFPEMIRNGISINVVYFEKSFIDIGTPESLEAAQLIVKN